MSTGVAMQQLLRAAALFTMCVAGCGLLIVMAADYWVASDMPLPKHPLVRSIAGPLFVSRRQRLYTKHAGFPDREVSAVLAVLAAAVLGLCCKQRCWILRRSQPQPSPLVVTLGWLIVILHSVKYSCHLLLTSLAQSMPWMAVHHAVAMCILGSVVWEPKCMGVAVVLPYLLHEISGAQGATLTNMNTVAWLGAMTYNVLMFMILGWYMHCGTVQRISTARVGLLVGALTSTNFAAYCTEIGTEHCPVQYDSGLDAFYALAQGQRPWAMKMWAGVVAFAAAAAALTCAFALVCVVIEYIRRWSKCERCGSHGRLLQLVRLRARCCGHLVAKVPSKVH
jgi:hypothetical protein